MMCLQKVTRVTRRIVLRLSLWCACYLFIPCALQSQDLLPDVQPSTSSAERVIPPYLKSGDTIALLAPSYKEDGAQIAYAVQWLKEQGFHLLFGQCFNTQKSTVYSGTDEERAADFQSALDNPSVKAIIATRGGYGAVRVVDKIDWSRFREHPKWLCGFSDFTVFHSHVNRQCGVATIHSMMPLSIKAENSQGQGAQSLLKALQGQPLSYHVPANARNRSGVAVGELVGGNLSLLVSLTGSVSEMDLDGKILFIEDCDEYTYHVDRMLMELKRAGKLEHLSGLIVGGFVRLKEIPTQGFKFGKTIEDIVWEACSEYTFPILFDFPAGHIKTNCALRLGTVCTLKVENGAHSTVKM